MRIAAVSPGKSGETFLIPLSGDYPHVPVSVLFDVADHTPIHPPLFSAAFLSDSIIWCFSALAPLLCIYVYTLFLRSSYSFIIDPPCYYLGIPAPYGPPPPSLVAHFLLCVLCSFVCNWLNSLCVCVPCYQQLPRQKCRTVVQHFKLRVFTS